MNYKQQLNIIQGLFIPPDTQMRMDCPFCKNLNTLSVDTTENNINWYCFHSTCKARGKKEGEKGCKRALSALPIWALAIGTTLRFGALDTRAFDAFLVSSTVGILCAALGRGDRIRVRRGA